MNSTSACYTFSGAEIFSVFFSTSQSQRTTKLVYCFFKSRPNSSILYSAACLDYIFYSSQGFFMVLKLFQYLFQEGDQIALEKHIDYSHCQYLSGHQDTPSLLAFRVNLSSPRFSPTRMSSPPATVHAASPTPALSLPRPRQWHPNLAIQPFSHTFRFKMCLPLMHNFISSKISDTYLFSMRPSASVLK